MSDSLEQREGLEGQHGHHLPVELSSDEIDDRYHEEPDYHVALEGGEGHLLAESFELCFRRGYLLIVTLVLCLDNMGILELLQLLVQFFDLGCMTSYLHLLYL